jgi:NADH:ubiquinone oxidoreductase subunit F (NADH-binding)
MGTPLRDVIHEAADEPGDKRRITGVLMGVSNAMVAAAQFDTPISYEGLAAIGSGLGSASFIVLDERGDGVATAAGASRFLAIESCGQCEPCKRDGLEITGHLNRLCRNEADEAAIDEIKRRLTTITDGARCNLAAQHQTVVGSIMQTFEGHVRGHLDAALEPVDPMLVAELLRIDGESETVDDTFIDKQPDWTYEAVDSGETPVERLTDHRA